MTASPQDVLQQLQWRYAAKGFDTTKTIPADVWQVLEQSLVLSPSSFGLQPWKFWVVTDPAVKEKLPAISWNQRQVAQASHVVVMAIRKNLSEADVERLIVRTSEVRGTPVESLAGFRKMMLGSLVPPKGFDINEWAARQVYIALGVFMTAAAMLGVDTCPMEGILPAKYDELLGLPEQGYATCVVCAAGYRAADDKYASQPKVRFATETVVTRIPSARK